jgi:hypothetical protein
MSENTNPFSLPVLDLYRSDFIPGMWEQICQQLDIPTISDRAKVVIKSVDFN